VGSTARASANTSTRAARARFSARAQASAVAPVVITSSITTTFLPLIRPVRAFSTLNAPATLRRRWSALSPTWLVVTIVGAGTIVCKAIGPVFLGGRTLPPQLAGVVGMLAPSLLAALVVTQAVGDERKLVFDERLLGIAAAIVAIRLRAPLLVIVAAAAGVTALVRLL